MFKLNFYSHPYDNNNHDPLLHKHMIKVAEKAKQIADGTNYEELAYHAGLLHDIGKLNDYYQKLFSPNSSNELDLQKNYLKWHSVFSAWLAKPLLSNIFTNSNDLQTVLFCIIGHHSTLKNSYEITDNSFISENAKILFENSKASVKNNISIFHKNICSESAYFNLNWDKCFADLKKCKPIYFKEPNINTYDSVHEFIKYKIVFSSLLQGDRISFDDNFKFLHFDFSIDTTKLKKNTNDKLSEFRNKIQNEIVNNHNYNSNISIIHAPTGTGKTKIFLDLIPKYTHNKKIKRIFYFSPLLALTRDFENKLINEIKLNKNDQDKILIYNSLHSNKLIDSHTTDTYKKYMKSDFLNFELFNMPFIVTTTQRLLYMIYSNKSRDNLKFMSLKNSLLIIDEIQILPKFILKNLLSILNKICQILNCKVLIVSATIPDEVRKFPEVYEHDISSLSNDYIKYTRKKIKYIEELPKLSNSHQKILCMANTRRHALDMFKKINKEYKINNTLYMSSGLTKRHRDIVIKNIKAPCTIVSTQVIEAGIDVSFDTIYREFAPLDNIVQILGRLNREMLNGPDSTLYLYGKYDDHRPYSSLEYAESKRMFSEKNIKYSDALYKMLPEYYANIRSKNESYRRKLDTLEKKFDDHDFPEIWKFITNNVLSDDHGDNVIIPTNFEHYKKIKDAFLKTKSYPSKSLLKEFAMDTANLPSKSTYKIWDYFDPELKEINILVPNKDHIHDLYDNVTGLDTWLDTKI